MYKIVVDTEITEEVKGVITQTDSVFIPLVSSARTDLPSLSLTVSFKEDTEFSFEGLIFSEIDWGDGNVEKYNGNIEYRHRYTAGTILDIKFYGVNSLPAIFAGNPNIIGITTRLNIGDSVFANCSNLANVDLLEGVVYIGDNAFINTSVKYMRVPRTAEYLGNCLNQPETVIELLQSDPAAIEISNQLFANLYDTCKIIVPYGSYQEYVTAHPVRYDMTEPVEPVEPAPQPMKFMMRAAAQPEVINVDYPYDAPVVIIFDSSKSPVACLASPSSDWRDGERAYVDWGDGSDIGNFIYGNTSVPVARHAYTLTGIHTIKIYNITKISGAMFLNSSDDPDEAYRGVLEFYTSLESIARLNYPNFVALKKFIAPNLITLGGVSLGVPSEVEFVAPNLESIYEISDTSGSDGIRNLYLPRLKVAERLFLNYLTEFNVPALETAKQYTIEGNRVLSINAPNIVTVESNAFVSNPSLVELNLGDNLQSIGDKAFENCSALQNVVIPSCKTIGDNIFNGCSALKTVVLPDNLEEIYGSSIPKNIEEITIPASVKTIVKPFNVINNQAKPTIYLESLVPPILKANPAASVGDGAQFKGPVYVKPAAYDLYKNNIDWKAYNIIANAEILATPIVRIGKSGIAQWLNTGEIEPVAYKYMIDGVESENTTETSVKLSVGQSIQVKAIGDGLYTSDSEYSSIQIYEPDKIVAEPLSVPAVQISASGMARWLSINATSYIYVINDGEPVSTLANSVQLFDGEFIEVKAIGDGLYFSDSEYSEPLQYNEDDYIPELLPPPIVQVSRTGLASWISANASAYEYEIDGTVTYTLGTAVQLVPGQKIRVRAIGDDYNYTNSEYSDYVEYSVILEKLETPIVNISITGQASWICVNASGYYYKINGIERFTLSTVIQLNPDDIIEVKGVGDKINYSDSDYSGPMQYIVRPDAIRKTPFDRHAYLSDLSSIKGTSIFVEGERVDEFNADTKADKDTVNKQVSDIEKSIDEKYTSSTRYSDAKHAEALLQIDAKYQEATGHTDTELLKLQSTIGNSLILSMDESTFVLRAKLISADNSVLSEQSIDLPLEEMIVSAQFNSSQQMIILQLRTGQTLDIPVGDLVSGLVSQQTFDAFVSQVDSQLVKEMGSSVNEETNELTVELKDKSGKVIASTKVVIPKGEVPDLTAYVKKENRDEFVRGGLTETTETWTEEDKTKALELLGALKTVTDKTIYAQIYSKATDGGQAMLNVHVNAVGNTVAKRRTNGSLTAKMSGSYVAEELANMQYVYNLPDNLTLTDDEKAKWCEMIGAISNQRPTNSNNGDGFLITFGTDGKTIGYKRLYGSYVNAPHSVPYRDGNGVIHAKIPTTETGLTPKGYVDGIKAELLARIEALEGK